MTGKKPAASSQQALTPGLSALSARANSQVNSRELVQVAKKVAHDWEMFAAFLAPDVFTAAAIELIDTDYRKSFLRAQAVLEKWSSKFNKEATCGVLIAALLDVDLKAQACEVFGIELVNFVQQRQ